MSLESTPLTNDSPFRPEPGDRDLAPQFVLPLVVRIERAARPPVPTRWRRRPGRCW